MSKFFCDSVVDIDKNLLIENGVEIINIPYCVGNLTTEFCMDDKFNYKKFYEETIVNKDVEPSKVNIDFYINYFEPYLKKGEDVFYVCYSNRLNPNFFSLKNAVEILKGKYKERSITVVDSLSVTVGAGVIVLEALKLHKQGISDDKIASKIRVIRRNFATYFVVDNPDKLIQSNFVANKTELKGKLLSVKPIFAINSQGKVEQIGNPVGMKKAISELVDKLKEFGQNVNDYTVYVLHANALENANLLCEKVREYLGYEANIEIKQIGPFAGMFCKSGTVGIVFHSKIR